MKLVSAVVSPNRMEEVWEVLSGTSLEGLIVTEVRTLGRPGSPDRRERHSFQLLTGFRLEIVIPDSQVDFTVEGIGRVTRSDGCEGTGILVLPVEDCIGVDTGRL